MIMTIWFDKSLSLEKLHPLGKATMAEYLGIEWVEVGEDFLKARMPVNHTTIQPYGLLHGGASCVLAETIGSVGSAMVINHEKFLCVGLEINANHIRGVKEGYGIQITIPLNLSSYKNVWYIKIYDEKEKLVCVSRLTVAIIPRKGETSNVKREM